MRHPKPWYRESSGTWYVQLNGRQVNLGSKRSAAMTKFRQLWAGANGVDLQTPAVVILDKFLDFATDHNKPSTVEFYKRYVLSFGNYIGKSLRIGRLKALHVTGWLDDNEWPDGTRACAIRAVKRAFQWAADEGYIQVSPIKSVKRMKSGRRETIISPDQWQAILDAASDDHFREFLAFIRECGCRPQEARAVEARHCNITKGLIHWPAGQAPKGKEARTIYLTDTALDMVKRLCNRHASGPILRNRFGEPWTKNAVVCRFRRIRDKTGFDGLCAYVTRHTFATESLMKGIDSLVVAELMGHVDKTMLADTYAHLAKNPEFLREAQKKARA